MGDKPAVNHATATLADYVDIEPKQHPTDVTHPFDERDCANAFSLFSDSIEVCIPRAILKTNAKSLTQLNVVGFSNAATNYNLIFELFGFIADQLESYVTRGEDKEPVLAFISTVPRHIENGKTRVTDEEDDDCGEDDERMDDDEQACDPNDIVAIRLRIVVQSPRYSIGAILHGLFELNEAERKKPSDRGRQPRCNNQRKYAFKKCTRKRYQELCVAYTEDMSINKNANRFLPLWDQANPLNPINVFTLENSMRIAKGRGGAPLYCDINNYALRERGDSEEFTIKDRTASRKNEAIQAAELGAQIAAAASALGDGSGDEDDDAAAADVALPQAKKGKCPAQLIKIMRDPIIYMFPCGGHNVYRMHVDHITYLGQAFYNLPYLHKLVNKVSLEAHMLRSISNLSDSDQKTFYASCINLDSNDVELNNLANLRIRQLARYASITVPRENLTEYTAEYERQEAIGLKEWRSVYSEDGDIADSIKTILKWDAVHLSNHINFSMPLALLTRNLSRLANLLASINMSLETIFGVATLNVEVIAGWLADMRAYMDGTPFQIHTMYVGDHSAGKSFIVETIMLMLIAGTFTESAYETDKAKAVEGKMYDMQPEFFPEVPPHMIGVAEGSGKNGKKDAGSSLNANTQAEALLKMRLTTGRMSFRVKRVTLEGKHVSEEIIGYCNVVFHGCSNVIPEDIPDAVRSRFYVSTIQKGNDRLDQTTAVEKNTRAMIPAVITARKLLQYRMFRYQSLISKIETLISAGVLPPVSLVATTSILLETLNRAKASGLSNTGAVRNIERVIFMMQVLAIINAIDIVFDSELSTISDLPFEDKHLLLVKPYLFSQVEHVGIALSLLEKQFESPVVSSVMRALRVKFGVRKRPAPVVPGMLILANGLLASSSAPAQPPAPQPAYSGFPSGPASSSCDLLSEQKYSIDVYKQPPWAVGDGSKITLLARELHPNIIPQPNYDSLRAVLAELNKTMVSANDPTNPSLMIKQLDFGFNTRGITWEIVEETENNNKLADAFMSVMSYPTAPKQSFLYCKGNPRHPYIFKILCNNPTPTGRDVIMHDPNYFDETMVRLTLSLAKGIDHGLLETGEASPVVEWDRVFSTCADKLLEGNVDEYSALQHCDSLSLNALTITSGPPLISRAAYEACLATYTPQHIAELPLYPMCFLRLLSGKSLLDRKILCTPTSKLVQQYKARLAADVSRQIQKHDKKRKMQRQRRGEELEDDMLESQIEIIDENEMIVVPSGDIDENLCCDADIERIMKADASVGIGPANMMSSSRSSSLIDEDDEIEDDEEMDSWMNYVRPTLTAPSQSSDIIDPEAMMA